MSGTEPTPENTEEDYELLILAILVIASFILGIRNRDKIKKWFDDNISSKFK
jgi:hypothetical protein